MTPKKLKTLIADAKIFAAENKLQRIHLTVDNVPLESFHAIAKGHELSVDWSESLSRYLTTKVEDEVNISLWSVKTEKA